MTAALRKRVAGADRDARRADHLRHLGLGRVRRGGGQPRATNADGKSKAAIVKLEGVRRPAVYAALERGQ
jgi:hypothetical protein